MEHNEQRFGIPSFMTALINIVGFAHLSAYLNVIGYERRIMYTTNIYILIVNPSYDLIWANVVQFQAN